MRIKLAAAVVLLAALSTGSAFAGDVCVHIALPTGDTPCPNVTTTTVPLVNGVVTAKITGTPEIAVQGGVDNGPMLGKTGVYIAPSENSTPGLWSTVVRVWVNGAAIDVLRGETDLRELNWRGYSYWTAANGTVRSTGVSFTYGSGLTYVDTRPRVHGTDTPRPVGYYINGVGQPTEWSLRLYGGVACLQVPTVGVPSLC